MTLTHPTYNHIKNPDPQKVQRVLIFIFIGIGLVVMLSGCGVKTVPTVHNHFRKDSVIERERLVPIHIPPSVVKQGFTIDQWDSLVQLLASNPGKKFEVRSAHTADGSGIDTKLSLMIDKAGNLIAQCESMEETYQAIVKDKERIISEQKKEIVELRETFGQKLSTFMDKLFWIGIISVVLTAVFLILTIMGKFKKLTE